MKEERQNTPMNAIQPPAHKRSVWIDSYQIPVYTDLKRADEILYATDTQILGKPKKNYFAMVDLGAPTEEVVSGELKKRSFNVLSGATENALTPWRRVLPESFRRGAEAAVINTARQAGAFSIKTGLALMNKMGEAAAAGTGGAYIPTEADRQRAQEEYQRSQKWADDFNNKVKAVVGLFTKRAGLEKTQKDGFLYDLGSGAGSVLTSIAALAITRNPAIMSAIFGAAEGQGTYEQAIEAGVEPVKAYKLGLSNAAWIAATEFVGDKLFLKLLNVNGVLDKFTSKALKSIKKKPLSVQGGTAAAIGAARGGMIEGVQETTQSIGSNVINDVGGVEDTSWREKAKQALYEGFIAFILGGVPGGAAAGGNFFVYRQNIAKNLMAAGVKEEEAHKVATELANTAISEDFTKEALGSVSGEINSPLTAEDRDAGTFKATLTQAQQRKVERNAWDAREQLKKEAQEAGMSEEEAEQTAEIAHANQLAFYRLTGIAPEEMRYMKIDVLGPSQTEQSPLVYNQAAMYRNPAKTLAEFIAKVNKEEGQAKDSYFTIFDNSAFRIDLKNTTVKHDKKHPNMISKRWEDVSNHLDNISDYTFASEKLKQGQIGTILLKIQGAEGKYGVALDVYENGRVLLESAFDGTDTTLDQWIEEQRTRNRKKKAAGTPAPHFIGVGQALQRKDVISGQPSTISIAEIVDKIKTGDTFNQAAAAMYRNPARSLAEFKDFSQENQKNPKEKNKSFYAFAAGGVEVHVPFERAIHIDNGHQLTDQQLSAVEKELGIFEYAVQMPGVGEYNGKQVKFKGNTSQGKIGGVLEISQNGRVFLDTVFFGTDADIDNWAKENPSNAPSKKPVFISRGTISIADIVDKIKTGDTFNQAAAMYIDNWAKNEPLQRPSHKKPVLVGSGIDNSIAGLQDFVKTQEMFAPDAQTAQRFKAQVRKALSDQSVAAGTLFDMGNLPAIYVKLGLPYGSLKTNKTTLLKATGKAGRNLHKVPQEVLENLPALVADPKAVFKSSPNSTNPNGYVAVLDATNDEGKQIIAAISPNKKGAEGFSFIPSVYDKGNFENFVRRTAEEGGVLYIKEKDSDIWGPLQSRPLHNQSPINSIRTKENFVNTLPDTNTLWQEGENLFAPSQTSLNTYKEDLKKAQAGTLKTGQLIRIGRIGLYERLGFAEKPFGLSVNVLKKITEGKHNVKIQDIENLPQLIADPVAVFKSRTDQNSLVAVVSAKDNSNRQVITILRDTQGKINVIPSMYGKDNFNSFVASNIKEGNLIYIDEEKALKTIRPQELQLLKEDSLKGSIYNIRRKENFVNALPDNNTLWQEGKNLFAPDETVARKFKADVKAVLSDKHTPNNTKVDMGVIPPLYEKLGLPKQELKTNKLALRKALGLLTQEELKADKNLHNHNVPQEVVENLPKLLADPVAVFRSNTKPGAYVAVLNEKAGKDQIVAILRPSPKENGFTFIPTVYEHGKFDKFVESTVRKNNVVYIDKNRMSLPEPLIQAGTIGKNILTNSIRTKEDFVKGKLLKYNKNYQAKQEYYQSRPAPRGSVTIDEEANRAIIKIFQKGDASTIVHELAHVQLAMLARARGVSADEEFAQLTADLDAWLGAPEENGRYSTPQQEKFAQGFEGYLAAGKAPNKQLESVFEKFAQWLAEIYQAAKEYLKITPEVKSIFDRLLAPQAQIQKSKIGSKLDAAKKLVEQMKRGQGMDFEGLSIQDIKELLKTLSVRKPAAPKQDLLKDLRKHGAEYANAANIDKEAYKQARVFNKAGGVDDRPDVWLQKHGYMEFEESTEETQAAAWDMLQRALDGEIIYPQGYEEQAAQWANYKTNIDTLREVFGGSEKEARKTAQAILDLEEQGYRVVEQKDLANVSLRLAELDRLAERLENKSQTTQDKEQADKDILRAAQKIKNALVKDLNKRQVEGKGEMVKRLAAAKTFKEITQAVQSTLDFLNAAWAKTPQAQQEQRRLEVPATNWDKVRRDLLAQYTRIVNSAGEDVNNAYKKVAELSKLITAGQALTDEQASALRKARQTIKNASGKMEARYVGAMESTLRQIIHITPQDARNFAARYGKNAMRFKALNEAQLDLFIKEAQATQQKNYKRYMRGKLSALFNRKAYEKLGSVRRAKYTPYMLEFLEKASQIWGGSQQEALQQYEAAVESIDPDNPPSVFQALINRVLWIKADPGGEVTMQDLHAFYEDALAAVRGDAAQKRLDGERRAVQEANIRLAACLSLKERKLPKGIVTYLLHGGVDLQTFIDIAFGQYETDMYESDPLPSRAEQSLAALKKIAAGSEEETVPGLRPDFVQYGGTPDVTFIWGDNNKGLQHIAQKHGADILPQVIDTVVAGRVERFTASKKTLVLQKGNIEAVLSLDEHGKQKTWLLTGWDATSPKGNKKRTDANGQVSTGSAATQTLPTFSRQDLGAVLNNSIAQKEPVNKGLKKHKINFREELAPETNQIKEAVFNAQINKDILRAVGTAYQLKTSQQILDKIAEMQKDTMQLTNYAYVKDQANGEVIATLFKNGKPVTYNVPRVQTINRLEALTFWIWNQNHDFVDTANGTEDFGLSGRLHYAYGQDQLKNLFDWLTPQDLQAAKNLQELVEKHYEQESQVHQRIYGFKLPKVEFYFPSVTERVTDSIDLKQEFVQNSKSPSFIKKRVQSQRVIQRIVNPIDLVLKHLRRAGEFIFEAENYAANKRIFKDRDVESAFLEKFGQQDGKKLYSKFMALLDQQAPQKAQVKDEFYSVMNKLFNGWVKAVMGLKPITGIKQFASSVSFAENMPWGLWAKWFAEALANPRKTADFMLKASPYIQARYEMGGMNEYTARAMASDEVAPIKSRWNTFTNFMLINTRLGDKASLIFGGYPYMKYLLEVEGLSQQEAARVFEKQATRTLQSSLRVHLSQGQANADSFGARLFLVFKNQQLQYVRKVVDAYVQFKNGEISQSKFAKTAFIYLILNPMVYTALTQGWFAADDDDREEDLKNLLTSPVSQFFGAYPFGEGVAGFFVDNAASLVSEGKLTAPRQMGLPMFDDITRDVAKAVKTVNADEVDTMEFINVFLAAAKLTGLPTQSVMNMGGGLVDIVTGKPVRGSLRAVGYTQNRAGKITGDKE